MSEFNNVFDMDLKENRLKTFESWPHSFLHPSDLAKNGFIFIGSYDKVECRYCGIRLHDWKHDDIVDFQHKQGSPHCSFLMNSEENRLKTFDKWPYVYNLFLKSKDLAKSGLFYLGVDDEVQCNFCNVHLYKWDRWEDDIVFEHYRHSPACMFLKKPESTRNIPIEPVENLYKLLAPAIYADYATPKTIANKYADIDVLAESYYVVKNIAFITSNGDRGADDKKLVRVDLNCEKFVMIDLNIHKHINEFHLKNLRESKGLVIMRNTESELCFYETKNRPLYYHSSELIHWEDLRSQEKQYRVLLFSVVNIQGIKQIRVDIYDGKYFILPELDHTPRVLIEELEYWNKRRWRVQVPDRLLENIKVYFHPE